MDDLAWSGKLDRSDEFALDPHGARWNAMACEAFDVLSYLVLNPGLVMSK